MSGAAGLRGHLGSLASDSALYGLANVVSRFMWVLLVPLYTRVFAPEEFGVMSLVTTASTLVGVVVVLGLDTAAFRWYWDLEDTGERQSVVASWAWCQFALGTVLVLPVALFAPRLSLLATGRTDAAGAIILAAAAVPLSTLAMVVNNFYRMVRRPWPAVWFAVLTALLTLVLTVALVVWLRMGLTGVFLAQAATGLVTTAVGMGVLREWVSPRRVRLRRLREMLRYSLPLVPASVALWVVALSDRFILQGYRGAAEVGLYQTGAMVAAVVGVVVVAFQQAWSAFAFSIKDRPEANRVYASVMEVFLLTACLVSLVVSVFAPEILRAFTARPYWPAYTVVGMLSLGYVMTGLYQVAALGSALARTTAPLAAAVILAAALNVALNLALIPRMGMEGAALATVVSQAVVPAYLFRQSQKHYPIPYRFWVACLVPAAAAVLMVIANALLSLPPLLSTGARLATVAAFGLVIATVVPQVLRSALRRLGGLRTLRRRNSVAEH